VTSPTGEPDGITSVAAWRRWLAAAAVATSGGASYEPATLVDVLAEVLTARGYRLLDDAPAGTSWVDRPARVVHLPAGEAPAPRAGRLAHQIGHLLLHRAPPPAAGGCDGIARLQADSVAVLLLAAAGVSPAAAGLPGPPPAGWPAGVDVTDALGAAASAAARLSARLLPPTAATAPVGSPLAGRLDAATARTAALRVRATAGEIRTAPPPAAPAAGAHGRLYEAVAAAGDWYRARLHQHPDARHARQALTERGLAPLARYDPRWSIGYAPAGAATLIGHLRGLGYTDEELLAAGLAHRTRDGRLIDLFRDRILFGIRDHSGRLVAFTGRTLATGQQPPPPKYLNTPATAIFDKSTVLFGLTEQTLALAAPDAMPIVVEGPTDVLAAAAATLKGGPLIVAVAACGTAVSAGHAAALIRAAPHRAGIIAAFDADQAGENAAARLYDLLYDVEPALYEAVLPAGTDPAELLRTGGADAVRAALADPAQRRPLAATVLEQRLHWWTAGDRLAFAEDRWLAIRAAAPVVLAEPDHLAELIVHTAHLVGETPETVRDILLSTEAIEALPVDALLRVTSRSRPPAPTASGGWIHAVTFPSPVQPEPDRPDSPRSPATPRAEPPTADRQTRR